MRRILIIVLIINQLTLFAQKSEELVKANCHFAFELYYRIECTGEIIKDDSFTLCKGDKDYYSDNGICVVDQEGFYTIASGYENIDSDSIYIHLAHQIDTISYYFIHIGRRSGIPPWPFYECCDTPCNGNIIEKWENGKIKISGEFKNGSIVELYIYNMDGSLNRRILKSKHHSTGEYYEKGKMMVRLKEGIIFISVKVWCEESSKYRRRTNFKIRK